MKTVYVVTSGEYSDYRINGIFSSRENAHKYIENIRNAPPDEYVSSDGFNITEWPIDREMSECYFTRFGASIFLDDGSTCREYNKEGWTIWGIPEPEINVIDSVPCFNGRGIARTFSHVSHEHAMKLAVEARQKWLRTKGA